MSFAALAPFIVPFAVIAMAVGIVLRARRAGAKTMTALASLEGFVGAEITFFGEVRARFSRGGYACAVKPDASGGKNSRAHYWRVGVAGVRAGASTAFSVTRKNTLTRAAATLGLADIQVGDDTFDDTYRVTGIDEEHIRGLLAVPDVQRVIDEVAAMGGDAPIKLKRDTTLTFRVRRRGADATGIDKAVTMGARLAQSLDANRDATPVFVPPSTGGEVPMLRSVSGGSGAPVGLGSRDER